MNAPDPAPATAEPRSHPDGVAPVSPLAGALLAAQPFPGYEMTSCLEASLSSAVMKANDANMDRVVAIKAMRPWPGRENAVEDFFSRAGGIARLRHPRVARGLDAGRGGGFFFMAHEFVRGEDLAARLERRHGGKFTERESLALVRDIADVLHGVFERGHSHGDVRPSRIMLGAGGGASLLGVGFAWTLAWENDRQAFLANPDYLAPERIAGEVNIDIRADLYALGCVWWRILLGDAPLRASTPEETLRLRLRAGPPAPRDVDPRLSAATSRLLSWLLEKDRDARPRTPRELLRRLSSHPLLAGSAASAGGGPGQTGDEA